MTAATAVSTARGWASVWATAAGTFILVVSETVAVPLLPQVAGEMNIGAGTAGLMITAPGVAAAITAPLLVVLAGRVDRRILLLGLTVLVVVSDAVSAVAPDFGVLMLGRVLLGAAVGAFWTVGVSIAPRLVAPPRVPQASAVITSGITLATLATLPVGAAISQGLGWRAGFGIVAGAAILVLVAQALILTPLPNSGRVGFGALLDAVRTPRAIVGVVVAALAFIGHFLAYTYIVIALHDIPHLTASGITWTLLVFGVGGVIGTFAAGRVFSRLAAGTGLLIYVGVLVASIGLLPLLGSPVGSVILAGAWGLAWGGVPVGLQLWIMDAMGERAAFGLSLYVSAAQLSLAAGSLIGGIIVDGAGIRVDLLAGAGAALAAWIALGAVALSRTPRSSAADFEPPARSTDIGEDRTPIDTDDER